MLNPFWMVVIGFAVAMVVARCRVSRISGISGAVAVLIFCTCVFVGGRVARFAGEVGVVVGTSGWQGYKNGVRVVWTTRSGVDSKVHLSDGRVLDKKMYDNWTAIVLLSFVATIYITGKVLLWLIRKSRPRMYQDILKIVARDPPPKEFAPTVKSDKVNNMMPSG